MMRFARLQSIRGQQPYILDQPEFTVGRVAECDIFIDSSMLSRQHARLKVSDTEVTLQDLGSTNGTFVNSMRVSGATVLQHGDVITIGDEKMVFIAANLTDDPLLADDNDSIALGPEDYTSNRTMLRSAYFSDRNWPVRAVAPSTSISAVADAAPVMEFDRERVPALLIIRSGSRKGAAVELRSPRGVEQYWSIGRSNLCDVVLDDPTVSSDHATLRLAGKQWEILDTGSTNGVKLNSVRIDRATCRHGDLLAIGNIEMLLHVL